MPARLATASMLVAPKPWPRNSVLGDVEDAVGELRRLLRATAARRARAAGRPASCSLAPTRCRPNARATQNLSRCSAKRNRRVLFRAIARRAIALCRWRSARHARQHRPRDSAGERRRMKIDLTGQARHRHRRQPRHRPRDRAGLRRVRRARSRSAPAAPRRWRRRGGEIAAYGCQGACRSPATSPTATAVAALHRRRRPRRSAASTSWSTTPPASAPATTRPAGSAASTIDLLATVRAIRAARAVLEAQGAGVDHQHLVDLGHARLGPHPALRRGQGGGDPIHPERGGGAGAQGHPGQLHRARLDRIPRRQLGKAQGPTTRGSTMRSCAASRSAGSAVPRRWRRWPPSSPRRWPVGSPARPSRSMAARCCNDAADRARIASNIAEMAGLAVALQDDVEAVERRGCRRLAGEPAGVPRPPASSIDESSGSLALAASSAK